MQPKKTKHRKMHKAKGRTNGLAYRGSDLAFGDYGLKAMAAARISARQIEAARVAITRHIKRGGRVWIRIFPDLSYTKKPAEVRMGKGKGAPEGWCAPVKPGRMLFELEGVPIATAREAMSRASARSRAKSRSASSRRFSASL